MSVPSGLGGFYAGSTKNNTVKKWVIAVVGSDVLLFSDDGANPRLAISSDEADVLRFFCERRLCLGQWHGGDCEVWDLLPEATACEGFVRSELRSLLAHSNDAEFSLASRATQLLDWQRKHQFCGQCGCPNKISATEHSLICDNCNLNHYPRISPCVIVAVTLGDKCLLARHANWPEGRLSTLAGFIEAGESAEQALHREVFEEVGVEIDNIRYIGSQAWPYPGQLMLGYIAEAKNETINVDGIEIAEADWFRYDNLPSILAPPTIMAGRLIKQFIEEAVELYG